MRRQVGRTARVAIVLGVLGLGTNACGGAPGAGNADHPLMGKTFAGQNKCNPKSHDRPFIIDWDATDQSSFQARAASDILVVRYEGCELQVLDGCANDSIKGSLGAYRPIDWTSGQLESIDIKDDDELHAKLPLGAAALSARAQRGEKFHMEYFVSGTRTASRSSLYRADLDRIAACKGATHYVYAFNLGAFGLASSSSLQGQANGSYFGFGAGGSSSSQTAAEKRGGDLAACQGAGAKEVDRCKVPIRLALRVITEGANPDVAAAQSPETADAANLAGRVRSDVERDKQAVEHGKSAQEKQVAGDGSGCLAELDKHDQLDPTPSRLSTNPKGGELAHVRVRCIMLAGQCDAGRELGRKVLDAEGVSEAEGRVDGTVGEFCRGTNASPRDQYLRAFYVLELGQREKTFPPADCEKAYETVMRLRGSVTNVPTHTVPGFGSAEAGCVARGGDCEASLKLFVKNAGFPNDTPERLQSDFKQRTKDWRVECGPPATPAAQPSTAMETAELRRQAIQYTACAAKCTCGPKTDHASCDGFNPMGCRKECREKHCTTPGNTFCKMASGG